MLQCEADLHPERFDAALREPMQVFLARALRRDYRQRFDNAEQMLDVWKDLFTAAAQPRPGQDAADSEARKALIAKATLSTQFIELGLSTRAANALDKLNATTVRDLLRVSLWRLNRLQRVGKQTTREISEQHGLLRERFPDIQPATEPEPEPGAAILAAGPDGATIDFVPSQLRETGARGKAKAEHEVVLALLRLDGPPRDGTPTWPSQTDLARERDQTRQRVG